MSRYRLAPAADQDIEAIATYTFETWGEQQTELYLDSLAKLFSTIAESPYLGRERKEIRSGIFSRFFVLLCLVHTFHDLENP